MFGPLQGELAADADHVDKLLLDGGCAIFWDHSDKVYLNQTALSEGRSISESKGEQVSRCPHDGFVEGLATNILQIRRRIRSPKLKVRYLTMGRWTGTKVAILVDGYPSALVLPITFFSFYQSPDDYNNRWIIGTFSRIVRMISFVLVISLPAIYIAIVSFHSEVLPIGVLYSVKVLSSPYRGYYDAGYS